MPVRLRAATSRILTEAGYPPGDIVRDYLFTCVSDDGILSNQQADLVAFGSAPHDMRSACIGLKLIAPGQDGRPVLRDMRYLGAPLALLGVQDNVQAYAIRPSGDPELLASVPLSQWEGHLRGRLDELSPTSISAAKRGLKPLDFVDAGLMSWAEDVTESALTSLLEGLLARSCDSLPGAHRDRPAARRAVLRLVFGLFACRVLEDKKVIPAASDPEGALDLARKRFSSSIDPALATARALPKGLANQVLDELRSRFAFASLTSRMLGHAYENALVTPSLRRDLGIYYTPACVADYILDKLPVEGIAPLDRILLDPCCGSGSFLLAGYRRLSGIAPGDWSPSRRHRYLQERIVGVDLDEFAREVANLALLLADVECRNGWKVLPGDARLLVPSQIGSRPSIVVTNPPFREIKKGKRRELSAEILSRAVDLLVPGGLIGVIMPQSFLDSGSARETRVKMLDCGDILEIYTLPGDLFRSNADTAVLLFRKATKGGKLPPPSVVTVRQLRAKSISQFQRAREFTRTFSDDPGRWKTDPDRKLAISPFGHIWERIEKAFAPLGSLARIRTGLQVRKEDTASVSTMRRADDVPLLERLDVLHPFALVAGEDSDRIRWLHYGEQLRRKADEDLFRSPKVLLNSNRNPGCSWRLVAAVDRQRFFFTDNFHGIAASSPQDVALEEIAAVLNSPLANAWFDSHCRKRKVVLRVLRALPFARLPEFLRRDLVGVVKELENAVRDQWQRAVKGLFHKGSGCVSDVGRLLAEVDALVYRAYGLSPAEQQAMDRFMRADTRPPLIPEA